MNFVSDANENSTKARPTVINSLVPSEFRRTYRYMPVHVHWPVYIVMLSGRMKPVYLFYIFNSFIL